MPLGAIRVVDHCETVDHHGREMNSGWMSQCVKTQFFEFTSAAVDEAAVGRRVLLWPEGR